MNDGTIKAKHARGKGKRGEREICKLLQKYGYDARRGWQSRGGKAEADVIADTFPFRIECKYAETLNIYAAFNQTLVDNPTGLPNVVVFRKNGQPWRIAVDLEAFLQVLHFSRSIHNSSEYNHLPADLTDAIKERFK